MFKIHVVGSLWPLHLPSSLLLRVLVAKASARHLHSAAVSTQPDSWGAVDTGQSGSQREGEVPLAKQRATRGAQE